jgi:hypothetical protein
MTSYDEESRRLTAAVRYRLRRQREEVEIQEKMADGFGDMLEEVLDNLIGEDGSFDDTTEEVIA